MALAITIQINICANPQTNVKLEKITQFANNIATVLTNNDKIICHTIDLSKSMPPECEEIFKNINYNGLIPLQLTIQNNSDDIIKLSEKEMFKYNLAIDIKTALKIIEQEISYKKNITYTSTAIFWLCLITTSTIGTYYTGKYILEGTYGLLKLLEQIPNILFAFFSLPLTIPMVSTLGSILGFKYLRPKEKIDFMDIDNHWQKSKNFWQNLYPTSILKQLNNIKNIADNLKKEAQLDNEQIINEIIIKPNEKYNFILFIKNNIRNKIFSERISDKIVPILNYNSNAQD